MYCKIVNTSKTYGRKLCCQPYKRHFTQIANKRASVGQLLLETMLFRIKYVENLNLSGKGNYAKSIDYSYYYYFYYYSSIQVMGVTVAHDQ